MAVATAGIGVATSTAKFFEGRAMQKKGERYIEDFQWQDLSNPFESQQVSTMGADMLTEQQQQRDASILEALRKGGTRSLVGGLGKVEEQGNKLDSQIAANLDEQRKAINLAASGQDVRNQAMKEKRQGDELAGYGNMMNVGLGMKQGSFGDLLNSAGFVAQTEWGQAMDNKITE